MIMLQDLKQGSKGIGFDSASKSTNAELLRLHSLSPLGGNREPPKEVKMVVTFGSLRNLDPDCHFDFWILEIQTPCLKDFCFRFFPKHFFFDHFCQWKIPAVPADEC